MGSAAISWLLLPETSLKIFYFHPYLLAKFEKMSKVTGTPLKAVSSPLFPPKMNVPLIE